MNWLLIACMTPAALYGLLCIIVLIGIDRQEANFKKRFPKP